ncbi:MULTISPECIES: GAF domain-containing protein [unclassified Leptolyngbya]|uniref:GAF domain-containing sensor histidine kinase n=1 Tax=unclassified Leptolyngbya TaxID=2650499 RepID=UPI0016892A73|nr:MULTISPECIES: GAF domain-containing protein [unclassified Leptolyngbya]MBD1909222.1 GAF domain-containing protein [Leptolyngbya sp. FACHB-8]MBD2153556.1 GAF domain-containing protein [Leptolyngbya sp. FACHB-16]
MLFSQNPAPPLTQEGLLHRIANRIRQSLDLETILSTTAAEVRAYLESDRVKIYQFQPDGHGIVVSEALQGDRLPSLLGLHFPADDIPRYARELFVRARQRSIVNLDSHEIGISHLNCPDTEEALSTTDIRYRPVDPCHREYLTAMGVQSSVVVPIVLEGETAGTYHPPSLQSSHVLWGLLVSHHAEPRTVTEDELQFIQAVVDQVGIAIAQSVLLEQVRSQARQEANINCVTARLQTSPTVDWQDTLEFASSTLQAGGRLYLFADSQSEREIYTWGEQPALIDVAQGRPIEENLLWQKYLHSILEHDSDETGHRPWSVEWMRSVYELAESSYSFKPLATSWAVDDIYQEPLLRTLAPFFNGTKIRSALIIPLKHGAHIIGCLTFFRSELDVEIEWAGYHNPDTRQLMPRQSFEVWRQIKKGQAQSWTDEEIRYAQALGERFAATVKQYRLYQQVQSLNSGLEQQVEERTEALRQRTEQLQQSNIELERLVERQMALFHIVARIRESLEIDTIFQSATRELSKVLQAERVAIYRFNANWGGEFVGSYEAVTTEWGSVGKLGVSTIWNDTYLQETQGGRYCSGEKTIVNDVYEQGYTQCHIDLLEQFHIKAFMVIPIFAATNLWGLLGVYQHSAARQWKASEVEFVNHIAVQLGVALQHAGLLTQTQQQAQQLAQTLNDLKQAQIQLFHSEKMSSLGQLVAGIAHEVNNPINFIGGNLTHIQEYTQTLLNLLRAYQEYTPDPAPSLRQLLEYSDLGYIEEDFPKLCASMKLGTERIREIVQSLRNFSRVDETGVKAIDLHEGLEGTLLILQHRLKLISGEPIQIKKHYGDLPDVECHAGQINQVFMNLIGNAIDELETTKTDKGSSKIIIVCTRRIDADWIEVSIQDNGRGIAEEIQTKLFDPFFTTKPMGKGTGLGLFISHQIVEKHGGQLICRSKPGQGTDFVIRLPVKLAVTP